MWWILWPELAKCGFVADFVTIATNATNSHKRHKIVAVTKFHREWESKLIIERT